MPEVDELDQIWREGLSAAEAAMTPPTDPAGRVAARVRRRRRNRSALTATGVVVVGALVFAGIALGRRAPDGPHIATSGPVTNVTVVVGPELRIRFPDRAVSGQPRRIELPYGKIRFRVRSAGGSHRLVIDGVPGFVAAVSESKPVSVLVRIAPGRYRIHCTIPGHTESGENAILIVQ
jgi:hypothetical protein